MSHSHGHCHHHGASAPHRVLFIALLVTCVFAIVEAIGGYVSGSLALLGDAGHMGSDAAALGIAAFAAWVALKPPSRKHSYGFGRAEVIAAWFSSILLLGISIAVIVEAIRRINHPPAVQGELVMIIAFIGLIANLGLAWLLIQSERTLNIRAALLHVLSDLLGSFAALLSGAVIYFSHWLLIDPILSIIIGVLILLSSFRIFRESLLILMEGVPPHIDIKEVADTMKQCPSVNNVHDLHVWTVSSGVIALSAHVQVHDFTLWNAVLTQLKDTLKTHYSIEHVTLQPEPEMTECQPCKEP